MRGHIRKRGETWTTMWDEPRGESQKRAQRTRGGFKTKREAERFLTDTLSRLGDGSYAAPSKLTLGRFLEQEWLPAIEGTLRPLSFTKYRSTIRSYIVPELGQRRLQTLSGGDLNALYRKLEQRGLSVSTRRVVHAVLHRSPARRGQVVEVGPQPGRSGRPAVADDDPCPGLDRRRAAPLPRGASTTTALYPLWRLAATTGMRRGELAGLPWRHLDLEAAQAGGRAAARPDPRRRHARPAEVGTVTPDDRARPRDRRDPAPPPRRATARARLRRRGLRRPRPRLRRSRSAGRSIRSGSPSSSPSTARPPGSRAGRCTSCATRPLPWR